MNIVFQMVLTNIGTYHLRFQSNEYIYNTSSDTIDLFPSF